MVPGGKAITVDDLVRDARSQLERMTPAEAARALRAGAVIADIRPLEQRRRDGEIAGALVVSRNVLEWRADPASPHSDERLARTDTKVIVICNEGYQSSLAAATLRRFGLDATDVIGGVQGWLADELSLG